MQDRTEALIKLLYKQWKCGLAREYASHPDDETLACFLAGKLPPSQGRRVLTHAATCRVCSKLLVVTLKADRSEIPEAEVPAALMERLKGLVEEDKSLLLEVILRLKKGALEILSTTGDVLVGQELMPAPLLRSRQINEFKDEVTVLKDIKDVRVEVKLENRQGGRFSVKVAAREKKTNRALKDVRITLLKGDTELESYLSEGGAVAFENVVLGSYRIEVSGVQERRASILLDIRT